MILSRVLLFEGIHPMNKLILISSLSVLLVACGGSDKVKEAASDVAGKAVDVTKTIAKEGAEKVAATAGASTEMTEKAGDMAKTAVTAATGAMDKKAAVQEAKKITKAFGGALKKELKTAMKAGGPINALDVCNTKATPIANDAAKEFNATISRVSLKNRNPDNVPNDWQKAVLEDFDARAAKGESVKKMGFSEIVEHDGKKQLRFMKALPTGGVCLECHGSSIEADVLAKITELYPEDNAIGYEKGQVRGAVVILKDMN